MFPPTCLSAGASAQGGGSPCLDEARGAVTRSGGWTERVRPSRGATRHAARQVGLQMGWSRPEADCHTRTALEIAPEQGEEKWAHSK